MAKRPVFDLRRILGFVQSVFGAGQHTKRVLSVSNATLGVLSAGPLRVYTIGQGL